MLNVIRTRRSHRRFLKKDVENEKIDDLLRAAFYAPTSKSLKPCEFIIVKDVKFREDLSKASRYSKFVNGAPVIIVVCYDGAKNRRFKEDSSIAAAHISLEAENQGLATCFVQIVEAYEGDVGNSEDYVKKLLDVPENYRVLCLLPIGYPDGQLSPKTDAEFDRNRVHTDRFSKK